MNRRAAAAAIPIRHPHVIASLRLDTTMTTNRPRKTTRLKQLYDRKDKILVCITAPSPYGAKMIEAAGFEYTYVAGGATGSSMLGMPDNGTISLTEFVWMAKLIADAVDIPVAADVDACFGGIFHVQRAVTELIRAGLAGIRIEDQPFIGKRFGGMAGKEVIPTAEAVAKYRVAVDTRNGLDPDFQIIARCEALTASNSKGLPEAIERMRAYKAAGADVLHLEGPRSIDEIKAVRAAVDGPMTSNFYNLPEDLAPEEAFALGLCEARYPRLLSGAMHTAGWDVLQRFKTQGYQGVRDFYRQFANNLESRAPDASQSDWMREMEQKYLPSELLQKYERGAS
jgi:2-methylisocitrate lyase-like PEP mutase family enzyme